MLKDTSKFKWHDYVYQKDGFVLARGYWEGSDKLSLACRWEDDGIGYPQTFGKPQWMLLPQSNMAVEVISTLDPSQSKVAITLT